MRKATGQQPPLRQGELGRWRLVADLQERLERIGREDGVGASFADRRRRLQLGHYLGLFLFGLLNPAVRTMRGLCAASHLPRLQEEVCARPVSLGSFSEAQAVVDPRLLERVFEELSEEISRREIWSARGLRSGSSKTAPCGRRCRGCAGRCGVGRAPLRVRCDCT